MSVLFRAFKGYREFAISEGKRLKGLEIKHFGVTCESHKDKQLEK